MARPNEVRCLDQVRKAFVCPTLPSSFFCNADGELILEILKSARENENPNDFPDFLCEGGFIEHFEVSPSKEGRKGSSFRKEESRAIAETKGKLEEWDAAFLLSQNKPGTMQTASIENRYEGFSYADFITSLQRNITSHLESLQRKGLTGYSNATFLVENSGARLCVYEHDAFSEFYNIHTDRKALEVLRPCSAFVRLFIFVAMDSVEILDLSNLEGLISKASDDLDIRGGRLRDINPKAYIDW